MGGNVGVQSTTGVVQGVKQSSIKLNTIFKTSQKN